MRTRSSQHAIRVPSSEEFESEVESKPRITTLFGVVIFSSIPATVILEPESRSASVVHPAREDSPL